MIKKIMTVFIISLFSLVNAYAITIEMDCPLEVKKGENISIPIHIKDLNESKISSVAGAFSYSADNLKLNRFSDIYNQWNDLSENDNFSFGDSTYNSLILNNNEQVFKANFTVLDTSDSSINLAINDIQIKDDSGNSISDVSDAKCSMKVVSDNNSLSFLSIPGITLSPSFDSNITSYSATTNLSAIKVNYTTSDADSKVTCVNYSCDYISLYYGKNIITIQVTSSNQESKLYKITINRIDNRDTNNNLSELSLSNGKIYFEKNKTKYAVSVSGEVEKLTINSKLESNKAQYIAWADKKEVKLDYGLNLFIIKVRADNGKTKEYRLSVTRQDNRDSNTSIKSISIAPLDKKYNFNTINNKLKVNKSLETIKLKVDTESNKATYKIKGPEKLVIGDNIFKIIVTAENKDTKEYKLNVIRSDEDGEQSDAVLLKDLKIDGFTIPFDANTFNYVITSNNKKFNVHAKSQNNNTVQVVNDGVVDSNNDILINVTSENGVLQVYTVHVNKLESGKFNIFTIIIIFLSIFIVVASTYLFISRKKEKKLLRDKIKEDTVTDLKKNISDNDII